MILNGWKEVAKYLGRGVRTVQRWEQLGLPLLRPCGHPRSAVVAVSDDVDHWLRALKTVPVSQRSDWRRSRAMLLTELRQRRADQRRLTRRMRQECEHAFAGVNRLREIARPVGSPVTGGGHKGGPAAAGKKGASRIAGAPSQIANWRAAFSGRLFAPPRPLC